MSLAALWELDALLRSAGLDPEVEVVTGAWGRVGRLTVANGPHRWLATSRESARQDGRPAPPRRLLLFPTNHGFQADVDQHEMEGDPGELASVVLSNTWNGKPRRSDGR